MNGIRITVTEGETASGEKEFFFPDTKDTVVLGRDPARCDVVFAQQLRERGVGSEHLALRRSLGRYRLALNTENAVRVDGVPAFDEQELVRTAVLQLDRGATLKVEVLDDRPETMVHDKPSEQVGSAVRRARSWVAPAVAGLVVVVVAVGYLLVGQRRIETAGLQAVPADVIARTTKSVYAVLMRSADGGESAVGTAWIGPGGSVITNAHVAEAFFARPKGGTLLIRSSTAPHRDHEVRSVTLHPGYELFAKAAAEYDPAERGVKDSKRRELIPVADVALMELADKAGLGPALPLLPEARAESLGAGEPIAYVGFPGEGLVTGSIRNPVPISQKAQIINVTDSFLAHRTGGQNRLVLHSLPLHGGASGSPVVNTSGQVIAVLNAGNMVFVSGKRTPSAAAINFAQRVDYVYDLLDKGRMRERTALYQKEWEEGFKRFERSQDLDLKIALDRLRGELGARGEPQMAEVRRPFTRIDPDAKGPAERVRLPLQPGAYLWFVTPNIPADLDLILVEGGKKKIAEDVRGSSFALLAHQTDAPQELDLVVLHSAPALDPKVEYTLRTYFWPAASLAPVEDRWVRRAKDRLRTDADPAPILSRTEQTTSPAAQGDLGNAAFDARVPGPGHALFIAVPRSPTAIAVIVKSGEDIIARAQSERGAAAAFVPLEGPARDLEVIVLSPRPGASFDLRGFHWARAPGK